MTKEERLAELNAKLAASKSLGAGYKERVAAIEAEIERVEQSDD